ncbi:MAG: dTDP-4-dehydrorhamnose reductase [Dehalococcoidia bacterium]|jgi:dTDP-4-dehydrorhamnose reductase
MKVLVTGAGGMLAEDLVPCLSQRGHEVVPIAEIDLDICDLERVKSAVSRIKPDILINCAAYTDVDGAEANRDTAFRVNGLGVKNLASACAEAGCAIAHFSTDYIFNGKKRGPYRIEDKPHPLNAYGESKLEGERYLQQLASRFYLIRTSWLFGLHGKNFVETILKASEKQSELRVVNDQRGAPTFTQDLSRAVADLISTGRCGIYHITNQGKTSWYGYAAAIIKKARRNTAVVPVSSGEINRPAVRPKNSSLDPYPLKETIGYLLPSWEDALERYLSQREVKAL